MSGATPSGSPRVLVLDVGGTHVKLLVTGASEPRRFDSGRDMTPERMVAGVRAAARGWEFDVVSLGLPAPIVGGRPRIDPPHLGAGWIEFDYERAFGRPVRLINDAAMQALGSYEGGRMLFLGLGTGLGSTLIVDGVIVPMEVGHMPYRHGKAFEDYVGVAGLERLGQRKWVRHVHAVLSILEAALLPDYIVLGGGNVKRLETLPGGVRRGSNDNAFLGGFRLWEASRGASESAPGASR